MLSGMKGAETATGRMQWATALIGIPVGVVLGRYALQEPIPFLISVSYRHSPSLLSISISRSGSRSVSWFRATCVSSWTLPFPG